MIFDQRQSTVACDSISCQLPPILAAYGLTATSNPPLLVILWPCFDKLIFTADGDSPCPTRPNMSFTERTACTNHGEWTGWSTGRRRWAGQADRAGTAGHGRTVNGIEANCTQQHNPNSMLSQATSVQCFSPAATVTVPPSCLQRIRTAPHEHRPQTQQTSLPGEPQSPLLAAASPLAQPLSEPVNRNALSASFEELQLRYTKQIAVRR